METNKPIFPNGVKVKKVSDTLFSLSVKVNDFAEWAFAHQNDNGYVNLNISKSKGNDNWYCKLNTWTPKSKETTKGDTVQFNEEIPF